MCVCFFFPVQPQHTINTVPPNPCLSRARKKKHKLQTSTSNSLAFKSCRDGFLWCTRSYLRAWDRGIAVVVATSTSGVAEPSGRLAAGVELLATAMAVAEGSLPPVRVVFSSADISCLLFFIVVGRL